MFEKFTGFILKSAAKIFTWPNRYLSEISTSGTTLAGQYVSPETALQCSAVSACVRLLSETVASLPLHVYRADGKSQIVETGHPNYDLLHQRPNDFQTSYSFFQQAVSQILLHGNSYSYIERNGSGQPVKLWPLRPEFVTVEVANGTIVYRYYAGAQREVYGFNDVIHFKGQSLDGVIGVSVIHMAREGIGEALGAQDYSARFLRNDARPTGVIEGANFETREDDQAFREAWQESQTGKNRHKTAILPAGLTYKPMSVTPQDAQLLDLRKFGTVEIARWFRVPPTMIGDQTRVSYSSSESEMQLFAMHSLVPLCTNLEAEINLKLFPPHTQFSAKFDVNSIVRGDQQSRYAAYSQGLLAGFLTVADVRQEENLPFIAGTDTLNRPANMMPHEAITDGTLRPNA